MPYFNGGMQMLEVCALVLAAALHCLQQTVDGERIELEMQKAPLSGF